MILVIRFYADPDEPKVERLCGKFRKVEDAKAFHDAFVNCANKLQGENGTPKSKNGQTDTDVFPYLVDFGSK